MRAGLDIEIRMVGKSEKAESIPSWSILSSVEECKADEVWMVQFVIWLRRLETAFETN